MRKHYTYNITNVVIDKAYIGVRSCEVDPVYDLGKKYFSSSTDKDFIRDQKENPQNYNYEVLEEFDSRELAIEQEILLHAKFDIGKNEAFYNLSKQTTTGFKRNSLGRVNAFNIKENRSGSWPKEDFDNDRDNYIFASDGKITSFNIKENIWGHWPKEDFDNDRNNYLFTLTGQISAFNIKENRSGSWPKEDFDNNRDNYIFALDGMVNAFNVKENVSGSWLISDYIKDKDNYLMGNSNAYKLLIDPTFIPMPKHNDKDYTWCFDRDTLGRVAFLKTEAKTRDKDRFPNAKGIGKKTMIIKNKRKLIPTIDLPKPIIFNKDILDKG